MPPKLQLKGLTDSFKVFTRRRSDCNGRTVKVDKHGNVIPCCCWPKLDYDKYVGWCETCNNLFNVQDDGKPRFSCQGCAIWPYVHAYCSEKCQADGSGEHTPEICANDKHKKRVFSLLNDTTNIFIEHTFIHKCTGISVRESMTTLTWSMPETVHDEPRGWTGGFMFLDFPAEVMPPSASETALSLAREANLGSGKIYWNLVEYLFNDVTGDALGPETTYMPGISKFGHLSLAGTSLGKHLHSCECYMVKCTPDSGVVYCKSTQCLSCNALSHSRCIGMECGICLKDEANVADLYDNEESFFKLRPAYKAQVLLIDLLTTEYLGATRKWLERYDGPAGLIALRDADFAKARKELAEHTTDVLTRKIKSLREQDAGRVLYTLKGDISVTDGEEENIEDYKAVWFDEDDELIKSGNTEKLWEEYRRRISLYSDA